jgi:hypothetical protein
LIGAILIVTELIVTVLIVSSGTGLPSRQPAPAATGVEGTHSVAAGVISVR